MKDPVQRAAGGLVWRINNGILEVLLVHRPRYNDWSWPKGKPERRESMPTCAIREVQEETGHPVVLGIPLPTVSYRLSTGALKQVHYWSATIVDNDSDAIKGRELVHPASPMEIDEKRWFPVSDARMILTRKADRDPLEALVWAHGAGWLDAGQVFLVRHGRAKERSAWKNGEATRPLTKTGKDQAKDLVALMTCWSPTQVISSNWARCETSIAPYCEATELPLAKASELNEEGAEKHPKRLKRMVEAALSRASETLDFPARDRSSVLCTHRPVLPKAISVLTDAMDSKTGATAVLRRKRLGIPDKDPYLMPGGVIIAHVARRPSGKPTVLAIETYRGV